MEEQKNMVKKVESSINKVILTILGILLLVFLGFMGGLYYEMKTGVISSIMNKEEKTENEENKTQNEEEKEETILEDKNLIKMLDNKIEVLYEIGSGTISKGTLFSKDATLNEMSEKDKLVPILYRAPRNYNEDEERFFIPEETVKNAYKDFYGVELQNNYDLKDDTCPHFEYSESKKGYNGTIACGGTGGSTELTYKYKYTKDEKNLYVYIAVGIWYVDWEDNNTDVVYSDFEEKNEYLRGKEAEGFELNESNYKDFSHYKLTFTKKNNDYYFSSIEKINE